VAELAGLDRLPEPGTDGCSAPIWPMPLTALATATARLARPDGLGPTRAAALTRISEAMRRRPELVAGTGRCCTQLMREVPGITVKTGAEGVFIAALHGPGLGLALKVEDGATRASEAALLACLQALGALPAALSGELATLAAPEIRSRRGESVGRVGPAAGWPPFGRA
jgi:L-asparaginase II